MTLDLGFLLGQFLAALASASALFLVASGLSIIFGVTRIVNFAHGSFYMLGAYLGYTITEALPTGVLGFWGGTLVAALAVGVIGAAIEIVVLRRIYRSPELFQLVATFAIVLIIQDATLYVWGPVERLGPRAPGLDGAVQILGEYVPEYDLALIAIGPVVLGLIWLVFHRTRWGVLVRAATEDREMVGALGVNQSWLFTTVFFLGSALAGLGGALQVPRESVSLLMDLNIIAEVFVVVVIGGMGSVLGAYVAALLIALFNAFGILILPEISLAVPFIVMAVVLIARPWGLFGRPESGEHQQALSEEPLRPLGLARRAAILAGVAGLAGLAFLGGRYGVVLATDIVIVSLFAASLHFMMGLGGMASFGHAAYFGISAYAAAFLATYAGLSMLPAMLLAPVAAMLAAAFFGWFCVRSTGVYLAMLTLAAAQIVWSVVFQASEITGGDDGILGVWPDKWAKSREVYFLLTLAIGAMALVTLQRIAHAPFGYVLRAARDNRLRAEAVGVDTRNHQWAAFVVSGVFAGIAGVLFVFAKGSIFPDELAIPRSFDALLMVLLGGVQSVFGPLLGAASFTYVRDEISRLEYWRFIFGILIILVVILAPDGIAGGLQRLWRWIAARAGFRRVTPDKAEGA
ncbi:ABC transporter permease [Paralimibaculum aggregatum]|uniref:ABC transporter permease n=1 Tax=Paralimibaculum aggregatum TaxID=3036245 RepID=A0ABQ6LM84_9RHOB|nr:ABC transporter permease [Limibaculum sp. NKW23]GMG84317.1 ABC transporter permease [Limibaculum sp. NKW23]